MTFIHISSRMSPKLEVGHLNVYSYDRRDRIITVECIVVYILIMPGSREMTIHTQQKEWKIIFDSNQMTSRLMSGSI